MCIQGVCEPVTASRCTADTDCPIGSACEVATGRCTRATESTDGGRPALDGGSTSADSGSTESDASATMCVDDQMCGPPQSVCIDGACTLGCGQTGGLTCTTDEVCDTNTGRCVRLTGPCSADADCGPPMLVCESGQCVPGCGRLGGIQCAGGLICDATTGRCASGGPICLSDNDCSPPSTICELSTGQCEPGCSVTGCIAPATCDQTSGRCVGLPCTDDNLEENDSLMSAQPVSASSSALHACPSDDDFYSVYLSAMGSLEVDLAFAHGDGNLDVEILDANGSVVASGLSTTNDEQARYTATTSGAFYIRVFLVADAGPNTGNAYTLTVALNGGGGSANIDPIAEAGPDQVVIDLDGDGSEIVTLDGSRSRDRDGSIVGYQWRSGGYSITSNRPTASVPLRLGRYLFTLLVTDNSSGVGTDTVRVDVVAPQVPDLRIQPGSLQASPIGVAPGGTVSLAWTAENAGAAAAASTQSVRLATQPTIDMQAQELSRPTLSALATGASSAEQHNVTIPATTTPGTYYLGVILDVDNVVNETDETNNTSASPVTLTVSDPNGPPDLVSSNLSVSPVIVAPGATLSLSWSTDNLGGMSAAASTDQVVLSTDSVIDLQDTSLGQVRVTSLPGRTSTPQSTAVTIPSTTASGTFFIGVVSDAGNLVREQNESNNGSAAPVRVNVQSPTPQPDLVVDGDVVNLDTNTSFPGGAVTVDWTVRNLGSQDASGLSYQSVRLSPDPVIDTLDLELDQELMGSLVANGTRPDSTVVTIPATTTTGTFYIGVILDVRNNLVESDETNNASTMPAAITIGAPPQADLRVARGSLLLSRSSVAAGGTVDIDWSVENVGGADAPLTRQRISLTNSPTPSTPGISLGTRLASPIAAGAVAPSSFLATIPSRTIPGTYYVTIEVDDDDRVPESNEMNNAASLMLTVTP